MTIFICDYESIRVLPLICLSLCCTLPLLGINTSKSLVENLIADIIKVQTLGSIVLLGGDFNAHATTLQDTIDTSNLYELLLAPEFVETE